MKTYRVQITERLGMVVEVEAENRMDAERRISDKWMNCEYILDADHFLDVSFRAKPKERQRDAAVR